MKKVISFILAFICVAPVGCINASAEVLLLTSTVIKQLSQNDTKLLTNVS